MLHWSHFLLFAGASSNESMSDTSNQTNTGKSRTQKQRLELTWIGKNEELKLEPRILIEDPEKSYGDTDSENMLIHGDNLLALRALLPDLEGKVRCAFIEDRKSVV